MIYPKWKQELKMIIKHIMLYVFLFIVFSTIALSILPFFGHPCMNCQDTYFGKPGDDVDGVKICERCVSMIMWQERQRLGGEYLRYERKDFNIVQAYRDRVRAIVYSPYRK